MDRSKLLLQVLRKIPVFKALPPSQVRRIVSLCTSRHLAEHEVLCQHDTPSDEMYVLLAGELAVMTGDGMRVATIRPVTSVGEMGVITGQPRSATVAAVHPARVLVLRREHFEAIFEEDHGLRARVLRNFIEILADRVTDDNPRMREYEIQLRRFQGIAAGLEKRIRRDRARTDHLVDLLERSGGLGRDEILARLDAAVVEHAPTVLVVDDQEEFRKLVRESLGHLSIVEAADGAQALSTLRALQPDLVITDIRMPGVDGMQLAERLRTLHPEVPVVGVSGHVDDYDVADSGFVAFVDKPLRVDDFRRLVDRTLADAARVSPPSAG